MLFKTLLTTISAKPRGPFEKVSGEVKVESIAFIKNFGVFEGRLVNHDNDCPKERWVCREAFDYGLPAFRHYILKMESFFNRQTSLNLRFVNRSRHLRSPASQSNDTGNNEPVRGLVVPKCKPLVS